MNISTRCFGTCPNNNSNSSRNENTLLTAELKSKIFVSNTRKKSISCSGTVARGTKKTEKREFFLPLLNIKYA